MRTYKTPAQLFILKNLRQMLIALECAVTKIRGGRAQLLVLEFRISNFEFLASALFQITFPAVAVGQRQAPAHEPGSRQQEQQNSLVDRSLSALGAGLHVARTQGASLAERGRHRAQPAQENKRGKKCSVEFHCVTAVHFNSDPSFTPASSLNSQRNNTDRKSTRLNSSH